MGSRILEVSANDHGGGASGEGCTNRGGDKETSG